MSEWETVDEWETVKEPSVGRKLKYGYRSASGLVKNINKYLGDFIPEDAVDEPDDIEGDEAFSIPADDLTPQEVVARRETRVASEQDALKEEFPDVHGTPFAEDGWVTVGKVGGYIADPSSLIPIPAAAAANLGTRLVGGAVAGGALAGSDVASEQLAERGEVYDPKSVAISTAAGAALVPGASELIRAGVKFIAKSKKIVTPAKEAVKEINSTAKGRVDINRLLDGWEGDIGVGQRRSWQASEDIKDIVKSSDRRVAITHYLEKDGPVQLSKSEMKAALSVKKVFEDYKAILRKEGITEEFLEDYVPHFWRQGAKSKSDLMSVISGQRGVGMSVKSIHGKERTIPTYRYGKAAGLTPITEDIADIMKMYMNDIGKVIHNKRLVTSLSGEIDSTGNKLIMRSSKAPRDYVSIDHPSLRKGVMIPIDGKKMIIKEGVKVHPDIAPSLKFIFSHSDPGMIERGILAVNFASKRMLVGFSGFHANALLESQLFTGNIPRPLKLIRGKTPALEMLRHGKAGDVIDEALRSGLKIGSIEDVGLDVLYATINDIETAARKIGSPMLKAAAVKSIRGFRSLNKAFDTILWDRIMTSGKLTAYMKSMEVSVLKNARLHKKNPAKNPLMSREEISKQVAEYVNDAFGGLNWRRIAETAQTDRGRKILLEIYQPGAMVGRKGMQLAFFAPDWTIANIRILKKALPGKLGGAKSKIQSDLHRAYALRGALLFALGGSAIQMALTGKTIFENENPTRLDLGDGRTMVFSKQFVEPYHWVSDFGKTALNKAGILPKWAAEQLLGKKYLSADYSPPMFSKDAKFWTEEFPARIGHTAKKFVPISAQQTIDKGPSAGVSGFLGHPIYGETEKTRTRRRRRNR